MATDPAIPASLVRELNDMRERISALELANPIQSGASHDGTRVRVEVGEMSDGKYGVLVVDDTGVEVFRADEDGVTP